MDCERCKKCIWYEQCRRYYEDLDEECEYYDSEEEEEYFWPEMSYWKYNEGG